MLFTFYFCDRKENFNIEQKSAETVNIKQKSANNFSLWRGAQHSERRCAKPEARIPLLLRLSLCVVHERVLKLFLGVLVGLMYAFLFS